MAINYPNNPTLNDTFTSGDTTWQWDGTAWNIIDSGTVSVEYNTIAGNTGTTTATTNNDTLSILGGTDIGTVVTDNTVTINFTGVAGGGGGGAGDVFKNITSDDGNAVAAGADDTLGILGGTNISTAIATDTKNVTINLDSFPIGDLSNVSNSTASTGQVLKWDGSQWAPASDLTAGGGGSDVTTVIAPVAFGRVADTVDASGTNISWSNWQVGTGELDFAFSTAQTDTDYIVVTDAETFDDYHVGISSKTVNGFTASFYDSSGVRAPSGASPFTIMIYGSTPTVDVSVGANADTLDGFEGTYYLDYNNFTNTPSVVTLTDLSVGNELAASGDGAISYDNTTGVFRYTPPDLSTYLTAEANDLTAAVTWANVPDANITQTSVTQHQAALSITESQISDFGTYLTDNDIQSLNLDDLIDVDTVTVTPSDGQVLGYIAVDEVWRPISVSGSGGEANQNAFSSVATPDGNTVAADTETDTLTLVAGTGITIAGNPTTDTVTITSTVSSGATVFTGLTDVSTAGLTVDRIYMPAATMFNVDNNGTTAYTFEPQYAGNNPTIFLFSGHTYAFNLAGVSGHPFYLQDSTASNLTTGLTHVSTNGTVSTGTNAQGQDSGTLYWTIPETVTSPPNYRYQCGFHSGMVGAITIKDLSALA